MHTSSTKRTLQKCHQIPEMQKSPLVLCERHKASGKNPDGFITILAVIEAGTEIFRLLYTSTRNLSPKLSCWAIEWPYKISTLRFTMELEGKMWKSDVILHHGGFRKHKEQERTLYFIYQLCNSISLNLESGPSSGNFHCVVILLFLNNESVLLLV